LSYFLFVRVVILIYCHFLLREKMVMEQILCVYCGDFFDPSPRHKNQTACKKVKCQRAKKAAWQRHKLKTDPIYAANQKSSQQQWIKANAGYWKQYRKKNPQKAERNRIGQAMRNRKARSSPDVTKMDPALIAKMDLVSFGCFQ
jgi:hypothetical protein